MRCVGLHEHLLTYVTLIALNLHVRQAMCIHDGMHTQVVHSIPRSCLTSSILDKALQAGDEAPEGCRLVC